MVAGIPRIDVDAGLDDVNSLIPGQLQQYTTEAKNPKAPGTLTTVPWTLGTRSTDVSASNSETALLTDEATFAHPANAIVVANYKAIRLVSAGVRVISGGTALSNQGFVTLAFLPRGSGAGGFLTTTAALTLAIVQTLPGSIVVPMSSLGSGAAAIYAPLDNSCLEYVATDFITTGQVKTSDVNVAHHDVGGFVIVVSGATATNSVLVELVLNFEATVKSNAYAATSSASLSDPLALASALNIVESAPKAVKGSNGFDGLSTGEHQLVSGAQLVSYSTSPPRLRGARVTGEPAEPITLYGVMMPTQGVSVSKPKGGNASLNKLLSKLSSNFKDGDDDTMFGSIMDLLIPLAEKFLPSLLAAL